jgi:hypothetical protein
VARAELVSGFRSESRREVSVTFNSYRGTTVLIGSSSFTSASGWGNDCSGQQNKTIDILALACLYYMCGIADSSGSSISFTAWRNGAVKNSPSDI